MPNRNSFLSPKNNMCKPTHIPKPPGIGTSAFISQASPVPQDRFVPGSTISEGNVQSTPSCQLNQTKERHPAHWLSCTPLLHSFFHELKFR